VLDLLLTGEPVDAERALAWGLVDEVVARDMLVDRAYAVVEGLEQA
jgi:enoyl-CoA hydratase/carnithine racemase